MDNARREFRESRQSAKLQITRHSHDGRKPRDLWAGLQVSRAVDGKPLRQRADLTLAKMLLILVGREPQIGLGFLDPAQPKAPAYTEIGSDFIKRRATSQIEVAIRDVVRGNGFQVMDFLLC